jgi:uncharacterized protein (TIGR00369 family)
MKQLPHTRSCFVCGESNRIGLNLRFHTDGTVVHTRFTPGPEHIGFKEVVHGGLISTLLDEAMVWACAVKTRSFAYCAELNVRFLRPARPNEQVAATAELAVNRRGKIFDAKAELRNQRGDLIATATGKYMPVKHSDALQMATDFVDDRVWIFESRPDGGCNQ